jgi:uroporphyrinogen decarboxylase
VKTSLAYVFETIARVKENLTVPLIGFCGGPFTVATYFIDSSSKEAFARTKQWILQDPESFHRLLNKITQASIAYLHEQVNAGAQVLQIFDSWANILSLEQFHIFCLPYLRRMVESIHNQVPVILFCRGSSLRYAELADLKPSCISLDTERPMAELRSLIPSSIAVQGNIAPELLRQPLPEIGKAVEELLSSMHGEKGFIVNLGHGVLPDIPFEHVKYFVDAVLRARSSSHKP